MGLMIIMAVSAVSASARAGQSLRDRIVSSNIKQDIAVHQHTPAGAQGGRQAGDRLGHFRRLVARAGKRQDLVCAHARVCGAAKDIQRQVSPDAFAGRTPGLANAA
jgi:hypothetical protein